MPLSEDGGADTHHGCARGNGILKIIAHTHRQMYKRIIIQIPAYVNIQFRYFCKKRQISVWDPLHGGDGHQALDADVGKGAGLFRGRRVSACWGTLVGGTLMFLSSYLVGVFVWGKYMPEAFLGMPMTSPWLYSFLYNILWAGPDTVLTIIIFALLYRVPSLRRYLLREDLSGFDR